MGDMKVFPLTDYRLLGTDIVLDSATNQPNWKQRGAIFVDGVLLEKGEYVVVPEDEGIEGTS